MQCPLLGGTHEEPEDPPGPPPSPSSTDAHGLDGRVREMK